MTLENIRKEYLELVKTIKDEKDGSYERCT